MLGALTRGIGGILGAINKIGSRIKGRATSTTSKPKRRRYKVSAIRDSRTCALCQRMDGTVVIMDATNSAEQIAKIMKDKVPPFHINCRCTLEETGIFGGVI
jgi:hypothetical protein